MKFNRAVQLIIMLMTMSCDMNLSVDKDFVTSLKSIGNGLTCEEVFLSNGEKRIERNTFVYGETLYVNFNNMSGFVKESGVVEPGLKITAIKSNGDTVFHENDVYLEDTEGFDHQPLLLSSYITLADPFRSSKDYKLFHSCLGQKGRWDI